MTLIISLKSVPEKTISSFSFAQNKMNKKQRFLPCRDFFLCLGESLFDQISMQNIFQ